MKKIKVLVITNGAMYPFSKSAPAQVLYEVLIRLSHKKDYLFDCFYAISPSCKTVKRELSDNLFVHEIGFPLNNIGKLIKKFFIILNISILIKNYDIILFNTPPINYFFIVLLMGKILRKKNIYIAHGGIFEKREKSINRFSKYLFFHSSNLLNLIITVSHTMKTLIFEKFPNFSIENIKVVHNGVDLKKNHLFEKKKKEWSSPKEKIIIGFIGRLEPVKNVELVIQAVEKIVSKKRCKLLIAGEGKNKHLLKQIARKLSLENCVEFLGQVDGKNKELFFNSIDILIVPSFYEPFGLVILEGMKVGIPVIASNVGGIPEIIKNGENGFLISPYDAEDLAHKILYLVSNPNIVRGITTKAMENIENYFNWDRAAEEYDLIFRKVLNSNLQLRFFE